MKNKTLIKSLLAAAVAGLGLAAQADINVGVTVSATGPAASWASRRRTPSP